MKKLISLTLCLIMAFSLVSFAETAAKEEVGSLEVNGTFTLKARVPEGYTVSLFYSDSLMSIWSIMSEDETKPIMSMVIAYDEAYADIERFNDLDDEALAEIEATYSEYEMEFGYTETKLGTKLLMATEVGDYQDYVSFFSIYMGYCIEFTLMSGMDTEAALTAEDIELAIDFLSDLDFEPIEEAAE